MSSYASYYAGAPMRRPAPLTDVSTIGTAAVVLAACLTLVALAQGIGAFLAADVYADAALEGRAPADVVTWVDALLLVQIPLMIATYVVTCLWLWRARENAIALSPQVPHRRGAIWVWLGWWMPIVSLWFPFQVVRDVRNGSIGNRPPQAFVGLWWAAFLIFATMDRLVAQLASSTSPLTPTGADHLLTARLITAVVTLVAGVLWIGVVHEITSNQTEETSAAGNLPQPPASY